ncbi:hypothetical protein MRX96_054067 [Rhipicephalus microplus]
MHRTWQGATAMTTRAGYDTEPNGSDGALHETYTPTLLTDLHALISGAAVPHRHGSASLRTTLATPRPPRCRLLAGDGTEKAFTSREVGDSGAWCRMARRAVM